MASSWWRHQMELFSALLAICAGNSPVPGEFPAQRPVTRSFDVFFDLRLNKRLSKQSWDWWATYNLTRRTWVYVCRLNTDYLHIIDRSFFPFLVFAWNGFSLRKVKLKKASNSSKLHNSVFIRRIHIPILDKINEIRYLKIKCRPVSTGS